MTDEREVEVHDPDLKPTGTRRLIDVVLKGGPLPQGEDFEFTIDGEKPKHVTRVTLEAGVGDVMRMTTEQILVFADVMTRVAGWEKSAVADVRLHSEAGDSRKVTGKGKTALEALKDAVRQLEEEE